LDRILELPPGKIYIANALLHLLGLIMLMADYKIHPPQRLFTSSQIILWLIYPLFYSAYSAIRGALTGWYPYPFLDPQHTSSMMAIILICLLLTLSFYLVGLGVVKYNNHCYKEPGF